MNGHDILDAAGGIRPEYVNVYEGRRRRFRAVYRWGAIAACLCLIAAAVIFIPKMTRSYNDTEDAPGGQGYASAEGLERDGDAEMAAASNNEEREEMAVNDGVAAEEDAVSDGDYPAMLMVNGILYQDSYEPYMETVDETQVQKASGYAESGIPARDGEQNFDRTSDTSYYVIDDDRIAVKMGLEESWVIFRVKTNGRDVSEEYLDPMYGVPDVAVDTQNTPAEVQDAPADGYDEARIYAPELLDLQERISAAMGPGNELFFVTASMILESPDRLHVFVNTEDEKLIRLLESYNTEDVLMEIEYSGQSGMEE